MGILNDLPKFESQILSNKQDKEFEILYYVNKARVLLLFGYVLDWYKFQSNDVFFVIDIIYERIYICHESYCQNIANPLLGIIYKQKEDSTFVYKTMISCL